MEPGIQINVVEIEQDTVALFSSVATCMYETSKNAGVGTVRVDSIQANTVI